MLYLVQQKITILWHHNDINISLKLSEILLIVGWKKQLRIKLITHTTIV